MAGSTTVGGGNPEGNGSAWCGAAATVTVCDKVNVSTGAASDGGDGGGGGTTADGIAGGSGGTAGSGGVGGVGVGGVGVGGVGGVGVGGGKGAAGCGGGGGGAADNGDLSVPIFCRASAVAASPKSLFKTGEIAAVPPNFDD